ncbi:MAG: D-alanyl-D-alanine carboxypeptidase/D-alanyl-D-alanine-endopeptidase [Umezawaea sp.]
MPGPGDPDSGASDELSWPTEDDDSGAFEIAPESQTTPDPGTTKVPKPDQPKAQEPDHSTVQLPDPSKSRVSDPPTVQVQRPKLPAAKPVPPPRPADPPTMRMPVPRPQPKLPQLSPPQRPQVQSDPPTQRAMPERIPPQGGPVPDGKPAQRAEPLQTKPVQTKPAQPEPETEEQAAEPKRRKPLLLISALVLVVALAGGAVYASVTLDWFGGTVALTTQPPAPPAKVSLSVKGVAKDAPTPSASGISAALAGPAAAGVLSPLTGVVIDPATGTALWQEGDATPLIPASTIKILATAAALLSLDHTAQLSTKVVQGDAPGTVVVIGGGDPTLSSRPAGTTTVYPGAATLDDLAAQVKASASGPITAVQFDLSRYAGEGSAPGWDPTDIPGGSVTSIVPFMTDGGRQDPQNTNSPRTGTPAMDAATALAQRLGVSGATPGPAPSNANPKVLGEVKSAPVDQLVENTMQISDNVLAEALAREVAKVNGQQPSFEGAAKAVKDVLAKNQFDVTGATVVDASGMSPQDKIPAKLLGQILSVAAKPDASDPRTAKLRPLLTALPVAGGSGTLANRYQEQAAAGKGWVRAKTGTLTGVNSLAGAVVDTDGRLLVFAFMSNSPGKTEEVRQALDVLAATLRGCGCA